ncbi:MAG: VWA domain-containing protein [archaeon]|nr:VWA domain-containing protein [archaeon]
MPETQIENICFVLDASRSMYRRDYNPNRFEACKKAIIELIRNRREDDTNSGFALIIVGKETKSIINFSEYSDVNKFEEGLNSIEIGGASRISDGLGLAIKLHISDIRKAGAKVPKILLISDGKLTKSGTTPTKMAAIAQGLEIKIDTIRLGEVEHFNIMKRVSELTEGRYHYCNDADSLISSAVEIAESNKGKKYQKSKNFTNILEKIADPLRTEAEMNIDSREIVARIRGTAEYKKCGICFQENDPTTNVTFNISGRYCPNCGQGFHIHCFAKWAEHDKDSNGRVSRCPHCFYLIKIPGEVQQVARIRENIQREKKSASYDEKTSKFEVSLHFAKDLGDAAIYTACPVCNTIFDEDEEVIRCGNPECNGIYHTDCYKSINNKSCKICGKKLVKSF